MNSTDPKLNSARAFVRSLNILLKYARLYSFDHARTAAQFETAWNELHAAIPVTNESGLLLGASNSQLLLDGVPVEATPAERSFAQLLSAAGLSSIQFTSRVSKEDFERLVRAFPTQNTKPSVLAEQLKTALANTQAIRINEIRFVPEDESKSESLAASLLTAQSLGADTSTMKDWLRDPQKLLQLIAAAEGSRGEPGDGPGGGGPGPGGGSPAPGGTHQAGTSQAAGTVGDAGSGSATTSGAAAETGGSAGGTAAGVGAASGGQSGYSGEGPGSEFLGQAALYAGAVGAGTAGPGGTGSGGPVPGGAGSGNMRPGVPGSTGSGAAGLGGAGRGGLGGSGAGSSGAAGGTGGGTSQWDAKDEDILGILRLLTHLGQSVTGEGGSGGPGPLQESLTKLPAQSQEMLKQALAAVAAQTPPTNSKDPMLLRLAEHLAIRFALERYERGEVKVNAVRQMIDKMSQEIEGLRRILGVHEQKLAEAGLIVESTSDLLDRQFWAAVPERGKRAVLSSPEAWCIPARNVRHYIEELVQHGREKMAIAILQNYASCVQSPENEARRRTAIGLADLADLYASLGGRPLPPAIQVTGAQLSVERDDNLQGLISAAFVRLAQEAGLKRIFPAMLQVLDSLDSVEHQRPVFAQSLRPRIGLDKRVPEYLEDVVRGEKTPEGLELLLQRVPRTSAENLILRFNRTSNRTEMQRLVDLANTVGAELMAALRESLRSGSANEAAEATGLLSRLDISSLGKWLPERLADWPRQAQDRVVRLLAMGGAAQRGSLLVNLLHMLDPVLLPLAIDEIGFTEDAACISILLGFAEGHAGSSTRPFVRLKAVEALGRLKAKESLELLRAIAEGRHMFHWDHHAELRLAAVQSLSKVDSQVGRDLVSRSGLGANELSLAPLDPLPSAKYFRRRRYPRVRLAQPLTAIATIGQDSYRLEVRGLSLSGGIATGEKHLPPGALVSMKMGSALRAIRAQVLMRDARAQGLGFEFAEMDLDERARLRKLLLENNPSTVSKEQDPVLQATP